jgi:hypothetical protein
MHFSPAAHGRITSLKVAAIKIIANFNDERKIVNSKVAEADNYFLQICNYFYENMQVFESFRNCHHFSSKTDPQNQFLVGFMIKASSSSTIRKSFKTQ